MDTLEKAIPLVVEYRWRHVFTCRKCGARALGDTLSGTFSTLDEADMVSQWSPPPRAMPVGWASYGRGIVDCPKCH